MAITMNNYLIGSGYYHGVGKALEAESFYKIWLKNVQQTGVKEIVIIANGGCRVPMLRSAPPGLSVVSLSGNLGHVGQLLSGEKSNEIGGWSGSIMALAMIAYNAEKDLVFVEQDCLMFGPCIPKMYEEIGEAGVIFGSNQFMECAQSLFLVRYRYILDFISHYLTTGAENDHFNLPEHKFSRLQKQYPSEWKRFSFGYDRDKPFNMDDPVFYCQQLTADELLMLKGKGLI